jgi:ribonuclease P protein component
MIAKRFRLQENQVKKVLQKKKPFFAYGVVANVIPNSLGYARIATILSGAQTRWSVNRNTLRRRVYDLSSPFISGLWVDIVYMFKKKTLLDSKDPSLMAEIEKDIPFLMKKIKQEKHTLTLPFQKRTPPKTHNPLN